MQFVFRSKLDHILFWSITIAFYAFVTGNVAKEASTYQYVLNIAIRNGLLMVICYLNTAYLFPAFFKRKKYTLYTVCVLGCLLFYTVLKNAHDVWLHNHLPAASQPLGFFGNSFYNVSIAFFYLSFTATLSLSKSWYQQQQWLQKMQMENLKTELQYLKAQLNPHFLFNSLNTIYFQIDKNNSEARESLQKFSDLLRYQLYECDEEQIAIEKEIAYLKSYLDLQRLRRQSNYQIRFEAGEEIGSFSIAPLLLISFVENACKHVSCYTDEDNCIDISLHRQDGHLLFTVINTKNDSAPSTNSNNIGLKNVKRRLELLYGNQHQLTISNKADLYSVHLKLAV